MCSIVTSVFYNFDYFNFFDDFLLDNFLSIAIIDYFDDFFFNNLFDDFSYDFLPAVSSSSVAAIIDNLDNSNFFDDFNASAVTSVFDDDDFRTSAISHSSSSHSHFNNDSSAAHAHTHVIEWMAVISWIRSSRITALNQNVSAFMCEVTVLDLVVIA